MAQRKPGESTEEFEFRQQLEAVDEAFKNAPIVLKPGQANISDSEQAPIAEEVQDIPIELPEKVPIKALGKVLEETQDMPREMPRTTDSQLARMLIEPEGKKDILTPQSLKKRRENEDTVVLPKRPVDKKPDLSCLAESKLKPVKAIFPAGDGVTDRFVGVHSTAYVVLSIGAKQGRDTKEGFELKKGDYLIAQILEIVVDREQVFNLTRIVEFDDRKIKIGYCTLPYKVDSVDKILTAVPAWNVAYYNTLGDMLIENPETKEILTKRQRDELFLKVQLYKWVDKDNEKEIEKLRGQGNAEPKQVSYQSTGKVVSEEWKDWISSVGFSMTGVKESLQGSQLPDKESKKRTSVRLQNGTMKAKFDF